MIDKRIKHGRTRPKWGSKRWWQLYKQSATMIGKCDKCGAVLFNPMSILLHSGNVCETKNNNHIMGSLKNTISWQIYRGIHISNMWTGNRGDGYEVTQYANTAPVALFIIYLKQ